MADNGGDVDDIFDYLFEPRLRADSTEDEDDEVEAFDITLPASHSYMGPGLKEVGGRNVVEAGWRGSVPAVGHHGCVFPGETVPMLLPHPNDVVLLAEAISKDKLFGLLCPDASGELLSGYGVLCEVYEAGEALGAEVPPDSITFKARAMQRFRMLKVPKNTYIKSFDRMRLVEVEVLPDVPARDILQSVRLASLDPLRHTPALECSPARARLRAMDAAVTPWPQFVYDMFDYTRMRQIINGYFNPLTLVPGVGSRSYPGRVKAPHAPLALSYWVASNLPLSAADRLALFLADHALLRLYMECKLIDKKNVLCCSACMTEIAFHENIFPMSSEGVHSNYTNLGGYMHDVVTVKSVQNVELTGTPSDEYSWFPGYTWHIALCATCMAHVGWQFQAIRHTLRPSSFFGLCRNHVVPRARSAPRPPPPSLP